MKYFKVVYQKTDCHEVWIESNDDSMTEKEAEELFMRDYEKYDDESESDEYNADDGFMNILSVDETDENGEEI